MNQTVVVLVVACFFVSASLLWLSSETAAAASSRPVLAPALTGVAVLLGTCGLWWPTHAIHISDSATAQPLLGALLATLPAWALAALACAAGAMWNRRQAPWAAIAAVATPMAAYVHAMISSPGVFRMAQTPHWLGVGGMTGALSLALIGSQLRFTGKRYGYVVRACGVIGTSLLLCQGALLSLPNSQSATHLSFAPDWMMMLGLVAIGFVLLTLLHGATGQSLDMRPSRMATADNLTGLPTRLEFESQLHAAAKKSDARSTSLALLFIDLDGFKPVNDTFGHSSGDRVLEHVGRRLKRIAKSVGMAARIGGDEFLLLATGVGSADVVAKLATKLIEALSQPYQVDEREVVISCSVGVALYPDKCHPNKLIARADAAMYAAKRAGGSRHCFYSPEMDADVQQNFDMLRDLRLALANDELELFFQPKIDALSGKVTAAEALLRWNHPKRGMVMPTNFIPLAERSGLIGPLGNWVIEAACKQARAWRDKGLRMRVAINLSAYQMRQDDIADRIAEALTRHRIHPSLLTCEITESAAMEDTGATQETFRRLGELGAHLSIDDFGTGYSSLSYLRKLPAEELKIDASFIKDLDHSPDARAVVDAVVKLAHALGLKVVAEGVENPRQQKILVELGCDELQGFLFAKPMSARALLLWAMDDRKASAAFRDSLFGETRQASRQASHQSVRQLV
jgi:diguanylate cyclase (GGDEF)-like protein